MTGPTVEAWPYPAEPVSLFARLRGLPGAGWLDSGAPRAWARYDIMVALPRRRLTWDAGCTWLQAGPEEPWQPVDADPWDVLAEWLGDGRAGVPGLPFSGGVLGCFGYDLGAAAVLGAADARPSDGVPALSLGLYDCAVVLDHHRQAAWLAVQPGGEAVAAVLRSRLAASPPDEPPRFRAGPLHEEPGRPGYAAAFRAVQHYLREGDCYQVNLARAFHCGYSGDPWDAYCRLRRWTPAPFGAWLELPGGANVLSLSPERFLAVSGDAIETRPIKGTRPRSSDPREDCQLARELAGSAKDRAENVMIV
ncbi:MAG: chorismate-binding protein, partial [Ectothiorhodospiraceae bacterium]